MTHPQQTVKIGIIGQTEVGKTSFVNYILNKRKQLSQTRVLQVNKGYFDCGDNTYIKIQFWDYSGITQDKRKVQDAITYLNLMDAIIIMYDVTQILSFSVVQSWVQRLKKKTINCEFFYLIANKIDLIQKNGLRRRVTYQSGKLKAQNLDLNNIKFRQISSIDKRGKQFFEDLVQSILYKRYFKNDGGNSRIEMQVVIEGENKDELCQKCQKCERCIIF